MKTHLNIGPGRSGTTSLWSVLIKHPEIIYPLGKKESLDYKSFDEYISYFPNDDKIHLDGTPNLHKQKWFPTFLPKLRENFERIAFIYIKRDQFNHWLSQLSHGISIGHIDENEMIEIAKRIEPHDFYIDRLYKIYKDDLLIVDFETFEFEKILDFLNIEQIVYEIPKLNSFHTIVTDIKRMGEIRKSVYNALKRRNL